MSFGENLDKSDPVYYNIFRKEGERLYEALFCYALRKKCCLPPSFLAPKGYGRTCKFHALPMDGGAFLYERKKI
jgi:hypothetical protein